MKLRNVAIAALSVLTLLGGGAAVYGTSQVKAAQQQFVYSGYLLDGSETKENGYAKYTFEAGTTYKTGYPDSVIFKDTAGVQVATSRNAFLHYADGSLSALTDGVIVDLNNMSNGMLNNFGINAGTILERRDSSYVVDSISGTLYLDDFLWKINDSQYILVSSTIDITTGNQAPIYYNDYVEMRYYNEGILMLITENGAYRTVASDCVATVNSGIQLDLSARTVTTDEEGTKMSMEQIVLDSDQVIDVLKPIMSAQKSDEIFAEHQVNEAVKIALPTFEVIDGEDGKTGEAGEDGENGEDGEDGEVGQKGLTGADGLTGQTGENGKTGIDGIVGPDGAGGAPGAPGDPGAAGTSGTSGKNGQSGSGGPGGAAGAKGQDGLDGNEAIEKEEMVEENEQIVLPEFSFSEFKFTENSLEATLKISSIEILKNEIVVDLLRAADGKLVGTIAYEPVEENSEIAFANLLPDTTYLVRVTATYSAADATGTTYDYESVFLTKQFTTNASGIYVELVVREENALTFRVVKPEYSEVKRYSLVLRSANSQEESQQNDITGEEIDSNVYKFTGLTTDTPYYADIKNIELSTGSMPSILGEQMYYTLKKKPTLSQPEVFVNKVDSAFEMSLPQVVDPDNGIRYYRYEVYEGETVGTGAPKKTFQISNNRTVSCPVDGVTIERARYYVVRVVAGFYDNEKTIEYAVDSAPFSMQGSEWPSVRFEREDVIENGVMRHDVLKGNIILSMNGAELDENSMIRVYYRSSTGKTKEWSTSITGSMTVSGSAVYTIPFEVDGLCASDTYTCDVYGRFTLGDIAQNGSYWRENERLGSFIETTKPTGTVRVTLSGNPDDHTHFMSFNINMQAITGATGENATETNALNQYAYKSASGLQLEILDYTGNSVYSYTYESEQAYNPEGNSGGLSPEIGGNDANGAPNTITITENDMPGVMSLLAGNSYKVRLSRMYDHTDEENAIKVEASGADMGTDATWSFNKNETVPDAVEIERNPITVEPITNARIGQFIEGASPISGLAGSAIIGYQLIPNYSKLTGQETEFIFYAFRCSDKEGYQLQELDATAANFYSANTGDDSACLRIQTESVVQADGSKKVPSTILWLRDVQQYETGTVNARTSQLNQLTRGQKYAFSFEVKMGEDTYFPDRSETHIFLTAKDERTAALAPYVVPNGDLQEMQFEHWSSGEDGILEYKYKMKINAADRDAVSTNFDGSSTEPITADGTVQNISVSGLHNGDSVKVTYTSQLYSEVYDNTEKEYYTAINHVYESAYEIGELTVTYKKVQEYNRINITVSGAADDISRIAGFKLKATPVTAGKPSRTLNIPISTINTGSGTITSYVNYSLLDGLEHEAFNLSLTAMYDNGIAGHGKVSTDIPVAIQALEQDEKYVKLSATGEYQLNNDKSASDSWFILSSGVQSDWAGSYKVTHVLSGREDVSLPLKPMVGGTVLGTVNSAVTLKRLGEEVVLCTDNTDKEISIDDLTPSITVSDSSGAYTIETANAWAKVKFVLSGYSSILDTNGAATLYMEVWKATEDGELTSEKVLSEDGSDFAFSEPPADSTTPVSGAIEISGLQPDSIYIARFYYMSDGVRKYPLDTARPGTAGENCYFKFSTKGAITFTDPQITYETIDYDDKRIHIKVKINDNRGYDIVYKLQDGTQTYTAEELETMGIIKKTWSTEINGKETHTITLDAVSGINWFGRNDLILYATPVSSSDNEKPLSPNEEPIAISIELKQPPKTSFDILLIPAISQFTVKAKAVDPGRMIVNDKFTIKILDKNKNDVTPEYIKSAEYDSLATRSIVVNSVMYNGTETVLSAIPEADRGWYVEVRAVLDTDNSGTGDETYTKQVGTVNLSDTNAFLGEVELVDLGPSLALYFINSVELEQVADKVSYTVIDDNGNYNQYTVIDFGAELVERDTSSGTCYLALNSAVAKSAGTYRLEFEFLKGNNSVTRLVFNYIRVNPSTN